MDIINKMLKYEAEERAKGTFNKEDYRRMYDKTPKTLKELLFMHDYVDKYFNTGKYKKKIKFVKKKKNTTL